MSLPVETFPKGKPAAGGGFDSSERRSSSTTEDASEVVAAMNTTPTTMGESSWCRPHPDSDRHGWVTEVDDFEDGGMVISFRVEEQLYSRQSPFQEIKVYKTARWGNLMTLDGIFQNTERDEFSYHEMISHVPLLAHPCPKRVLIIGGGDGGVAREVAQHVCVEEIHQVDIDEMVTIVSRKFFPKIASALDTDPRIKLYYEDGAKFIAQESRRGYYDVIVIDSSDPVGPNVSLFTDDFYKNIRLALRENGIAVSQGESMWIHPEHIRRCMDKCRRHFPQVDYYYTTVPVYSGVIGFILMSARSEDSDFSPRSVHPGRLQAAEQIETNYYSKELHSAAFVVPRFLVTGKLPFAG